MNINNKLASIFIITVSLFFAQSVFALASAITTCVNRPDVTMHWTSSDCNNLTTDNGGSSACNFTATPGVDGSAIIPNGTTCSPSIKCTDPVEVTALDTLTYDPSQIWNTVSSTCVPLLAIDVSPMTYSATLPAHTISALYTLTSGNSSNTTCRVLDNADNPLTSYSACDGSITVTAPTTSSGGTYGYKVEVFKASTGETIKSAQFSVTVNPEPCSNGATNPPSCDAGCTIPTDTKYSATGPNNDLGCAGTCKNLTDNYPTCDHCADGYALDSSVNTCVAVSGTLSSNSPTCIIRAGSNVCTGTDRVKLSWSTGWTPIAESVITANVPDANTTVHTGNGGTNVNTTVYASSTHPSTTYYLYNSGLELASVTVTPTCEIDSNWTPSTGKCESVAKASLSADPTHVSYNSSSVLTTSSTGASACDITGPWPYNPGLAPATTDTGNLTSDKTYTFQCTNLGGDSPLLSATVNVCDASTPIWVSPSCEKKPTVTISLDPPYCNYTESCPIKITTTSTIPTDHAELYKDGVFFKSIPIINGTSYVTLTESGSYVVKFTSTDSNGKVFTVTSTTVVYSSVPPKPIVSINAIPVNIPQVSKSIISWSVIYPSSVQVPSRNACKLTAKAVCSNGKCSKPQQDEQDAINVILSAGTTDINDPGNKSTNNPSGDPRPIISAVNQVANGNTTTGDTDWKAVGRKTLELNHSMDFLLDCRDGYVANSSNVNESQTTRVLVTSSNEQ